ncbi:MAG TPA: hydrogenase nickel incorporation protein HypB [Vicinamibacterales bacterium]|jgi:hydrogenase nickel incorporation protein HypB|nr:hydrogenase nickel incorporation protein HypB [Vicinamibacterales bacterium]
MCGTCGCGDHSARPVDIGERILVDNDRQARHNREHFAERGVLAVNVMGSPGSGKTALLEATARALNGRLRIGALAGDLETARDAERLEAVGVPSLAITTGMACHLDAAMVHKALHQFPWADLDILFIENVGNLVCPAVYDLGQAVNVVVLSVTEGEDKPLKYPVMFRKADLVLLSKCDLMRHLPALRTDMIADALERVMPAPALLSVSQDGLGIDLWIRQLDEWRSAARVRETVHV